ncbi:hypothetical protein KAR91_17560 [Candidatus Pacearchaeota archaeon]|nr:hypothetical protein [Candidatus Pacearchaeota archaeon]
MSSKTKTKIWQIVIHSKMLRSLTLLILLLIIAIGMLGTTFFSYEGKAELNREEITTNEALLKSLEVIALKEIVIEDESLSRKEFAEYEEVVPFISYVEGVFSEVDPKAEVAVRSKQEQIFIDHFADYTIQLKIDQNIDDLKAALEELTESRYITNILKLSMDYKPTGDENLNYLNQVEFTIRLFLR